MTTKKTTSTRKPVDNVSYEFSGFTQRYVQGLINQWLLVAPFANPAMLEMFRTRNARPLRKMVAWSGEFAGKYLTSAVQIYRLCRDERLFSLLNDFITQLIHFQEGDGYLGPWESARKLSGRAPNEAGSGLTWDAWGHYHILVGLLLWYDETANQEAYRAAIRIGDLMVRMFLGKPEGKRLVDTGSTEMNLAIVHGMCLLYRYEPKPAYLELALQIVDEFAAEKDGAPLAGNYFRQGYANIPFYQTPKPRWESLHPIMSLAELYKITGEEKYRKAFENLWWSMAEYDVHNNGGFTSGERATGNPYDVGAIETCCTIAWLAMSVEMLKLTGDSVVADMIERSTLNQTAGSYSFTGRWATYNTPMNGVREASAHTIVFQSAAGSPELNCCSVNSPRGFGLISEWAVMRDEKGLTINFYEAGSIAIPTPNGQLLRLKVATEYPFSPEITFTLDIPQPETFTLKLRIPCWSKSNQLSINGQTYAQPQAGNYYPIEKNWQNGDTIRLVLDFTPHFWQGEKECEGRVSIYRGPILLALDQRYNLHLDQSYPTIQEWISNAAGMPALDAKNLNEQVQSWNEWFPPALLIKYDSPSGIPVYLCDYASAGVAGTPYITWLKVDGIESTPFSRKNPTRSRQIRS